MKNMIYLLFLFAVIATQCGRKFSSYPLYIKNNSAQTIQVAVNMLNGQGIYYPDTSLLNQRPQGIMINPNDKTAFSQSRGSYANFYNDVPSGIISFVVYSSDTLSKYSWDVVRKDYKILQRYDLNLRDLETLNYTLSYPPTPEMKTMRMWPKYQE